MEVINSLGQRLSLHISLCTEEYLVWIPKHPMRMDLQTARRDPAAQAVCDIWTRSKTYGRSQAA